MLALEEIAKSWTDIFCFEKGKREEKGLRSPQIGALHVLMAHIEEDDWNHSYTYRNRRNLNSAIFSWLQINAEKSSS